MCYWYTYNIHLPFRPCDARIHHKCTANIEVLSSLSDPQENIIDGNKMRNHGGWRRDRNSNFFRSWPRCTVVQTYTICSYRSQCDAVSIRGRMGISIQACADVPTLKRNHCMVLSQLRKRIHTGIWLIHAQISKDHHTTAISNHAKTMNCALQNYLQWL